MEESERKESGLKEAGTIGQAMDMLGRENLEELAYRVHRPKPGNYIIVNKDGTFKAISRERVDFNSKYKGWDYYSQLVTMNKPIKSKLITSNNCYSFFCKNTEKLTEKEIDDYYEKLNTPAEWNWAKEWVKNNIHTLGKTYSGIIKIFFPATREQYREAGMKYWIEKSISIVKDLDEKKGVPMGWTYNKKKTYLATTFNTPLFNNIEGLHRKIFMDFLKGLYKRGYDLLYVKENEFYATNVKQGPPPKRFDGVFFSYEVDRQDQVCFRDMCVICYSPYLADALPKNILRTKDIRKRLGITQQQLSDMSDVPLRTIQNWENGTRRPSDPEKLKRIADALGVSVSDII